MALGEGQELDSIRMVKARKRSSHVLCVAIQLEVEVRVEELAARAHFAVAAAVSIAQAALSRRRRARLLGSRRELTYPNTAPIVLDTDGTPCHLCSHAVQVARPCPERASHIRWAALVGRREAPILRPESHRSHHEM